MRVDIKAPLTKEEAAKLRAGDIVSLTGYIYTGRDAAHKRMVEGFEKTGKFPFDIKDNILRRTFACQTGKSRRIGRPYNIGKNGRLCARTA